MILTSYTFKPIRLIRTCLPDKFGTPRQSGLSPSSRATLTLIPDCQPEDALAELERFSHIWLLFVFNLNNNKTYHAKVQPPRLGGEKVGVFASRSPHRYNPIGLSLVKLDKIEKDTLFLSGVDLVDRTPIFDIKPYLPETEALIEANHGWLNRTKSQLYNVIFHPAAEEDLKSLPTHYDKSHIHDVIQEALSQDPRPLTERPNLTEASFLDSSTENATELKEDELIKDYGFLLYDLNVKFRYMENLQIEVISVKRKI